MPLTLFAALDIQLARVLDLPAQLAVEVARELHACKTVFSFAELEETAIPSYTHRLSPIRYLFLRRLCVALDLLRRHLPPQASVLDFGCGAGLLTIALQQQGFSLCRSDIRPQFCLQLAQEKSCELKADEVEQALATFSGCAALDVLEHLPQEELIKFSRSFAPGALLVVSGPTENALYRLGRRMAGFKGGYHQRNVFDILHLLEEDGWTLASPKRWIFSRWLCPAFVVVALRKTSP